MDFSASESQRFHDVCLDQMIETIKRRLQMMPSRPWLKALFVTHLHRFSAALYRLENSAWHFIPASQRANGTRSFKMWFCSGAQTTIFATAISRGRDHVIRHDL